jgi:CBS domain-containing protein
MTMRKVSDIVRNQDPLTLPPDATVREACRCMRDRRVGAVVVIEIEVLRLMQDGRYRHMPVVDAGKVIGIVSRYDFSGLELDRLDEETGLWERI